MEELSYAEQLYTRVNDEYSYFIGQMKKESAEVFIKSAAEIADKDKIRLYLEEFKPTLSDEQYEALLVRDNPLNEIYEQWVKNGELNSIEDVSIALKEAADRILVSVEREKAKEKKYEPVPEEMMNIILDDMPSFAKSSVVWDELMEYGGIAERISNGEDPVAVVKSYIAGKGVFSYSPNKLTAKFGRSFYCTWSAKDNGDTAVINVSVTNLNNGDRYQSQRTFAWSDIADYFKKRIEQEENYNKLSDEEIIVSVIAGTDNYRFIDNSNGIDAVKNREELIELFSEMFNKSELNAIIRNYIDEAPTEEYEIPKPINKEHINTYEIYQIPTGERYHDIRFTSFEHLKIMGQLPDRFNYEKVYSGDLDDIKAENKLDGLFVKFNYNRPDDFKGHSLSVSDVIVINNENGSSAHYVDDIGYKDITDVFLELNSIRQSDRTNETININDYDHIRLVSRSEWNDNTLSDNENPAFEEITKSYDAEDGYYTKYAYNKTNSHLVDIWEEENTVSGEDLLEDIADHLKKMASGRANTSHYIELSNDDGELYRKIENNHFTFVRDENDSTQKNSPLGNFEPIKKKSGSEIEVGDRFLYNDREYTITSENGIYPNDVGATREEKTGGISYTVSQNIDRYKLAENGVFLGNPEKASEKNEQAQEISSNTIITQQDIDILRTLPPRKSVLNFTDEEKAVTVNWAERFKNDIAEKSPFYRAENGDWRAGEKTKVPIINIPTTDKNFMTADADIKSQVIPRGIVINNDTNWDIQISRRGLGDTLTYARRHNDISTFNSIYSIDKIVANAVLLDTVLSEKTTIIRQIILLICIRCILLFISTMNHI